MAIIDKPSDYFNTKLYTGTETTTNVTGVGFNPDWVWIKSRSDAYNNNVWDTVRGAGQRLIPNSSEAEETATGDMSAFVTDGFTVGGGWITNKSGRNYASWNWKAGGTAVSNTDGSITSSVSANQTAGFSIVSWSGNSTAGATIGHGLGLSPKMIIVKDRDGADSWVVYHNSLAITEYLILNSSSAALTDNEIIFYDTDPTSSVFTVGAHNTVNQSGHNYIAYCFADTSMSKMGSYVGNGSTDGTFIYTGFKPAWVMYKRTDSANNWVILDNKRDTFNPLGQQLQANLSNAESSTDIFDFISNGFKNITSLPGVNASGGSYIYMAFASNPFVTSTGVPATAR